MWNFAFKTFALASALALTSLSASAMDQNLSPFALVKSEAKLSQLSENYVNSGTSLSRAELISLDAKLHEAYGEPTSVRGSLKIWEVPNQGNIRGSAKHTTIMCGTDEDGSQVFVIDARGAARGDNPRLTSNQTPRNFKSTAIQQRVAVQKKLNDWD